MLMAKERELGAFKRYVMPALAVLSCIFMVVAASLPIAWPPCTTWLFSQSSWVSGCFSEHQGKTDICS
jgi:hypothetical protein